MTDSFGSGPLPTDLHAQLAVAQTAVANRIRESIDRGWEMLNSGAAGPEAFNSFRAIRSKWDDQNRELLRRLFKTDGPRVRYERTGVLPKGATNPRVELEQMRDSVSAKIGLLQSMLDQLEPLGESSAGRGPSRSMATGEKPRVIVAHAGDQALARVVAQFLERLRLIPLIVTRAPGEGEIDIDQLDAYPDVRFAVVLVAGDQVNSRTMEDSSPDRSPNPEAQLWLGYLAGRMGRSRVCAIYQPGVPALSRRFGFAGTTFDEGGNWKSYLTRRIEEMADSRHTANSA